MKKLLLGFGALLLTSVAVPAFAHDDRPGVDPNDPNRSGYNNGYNNDNGYGANQYGSNSYAVIAQHVRECRQHERVHQQLADAHDQAHQDGAADNGDDHTDTHDELADAHDQYHDNHGEPQNCNYWYSQYNNNAGSGYGYRHRRHHGWFRNRGY